MKIRTMAFGLLAITSAADARGYGYHSSYGRSSGLALTGDHYVSGHTTRSGSYVAGHMATNPNWTRNDNYSTRGNINPYTGTAGTKPRDEDPH